MSKAQGTSRDLPSDLRDVRIYLERAFPEFEWIPLSIDRHYGSQDDEIAYVVINLPDQAVRRRVRAQAEAAFRHLGYKIKPRRGADVYDLWPEHAVTSRHDVVRALARFKGLV